MASVLIEPVADALQAKLAAIALQGATVKAYTWAPASLDRVPAAVIEAPEVSRRDIEGAESQLGSNDWLLTFPVTLYVLLDEPVAAQTAAVDGLEQFVQAVDADAGLGIAGVIESRVVTGEPAVIDDQQRALYAYECRVEVLIEYVYP